MDDDLDPVERATCPACGMVMGAPDGLVGREVECPGCGRTFSAPLEPLDVDDDDRDRPRRRRRRRKYYDDYHPNK